MKISVVGLCLIAVSLATPAFGESAEEKGLRIAREVENREQGFVDHTAEGTMTLKSSGGRTSVRKFVTQTVANRTRAGSRYLLIFKSPRDIRNTALLTHSHSDKRDDQWLYLPAVSKIRRISSSGRSGSFVGSEFAYEDMTDFEVVKYSFNWVADSPCPSEGQCQVVDRIPKLKSGYSYQRLWIDRGSKLIQAVQYYDRRGAHLKTMIISGYKKYLGKFWRSSQLAMTNHLTGKSTVLTWKNHAFDTGLNPRQFTANALRRIR